MSRTNGREHAGVTDFRDMDLMMKIADHGGPSSLELAELAGLSNAQAMAVRLSWMRRFGFVDFDDKEHNWTLSPSGIRIVKSRMKAAQTRTIEAIPDEAMVDVMAHVTARYMHTD